jgi:hypothetical protein
MEFFSFLKRRRRRPAPASGAQAAIQTADAAPGDPATPEQIRRLLFDAVASGDPSRLDALCEEHKEVILQHADGWLTVPEQFKSNPEIYAWYGNGLRAIAQYCAEKLGRSELAERPKTMPAPH